MAKRNTGPRRPARPAEPAMTFNELRQAHAAATQIALIVDHGDGRVERREGPAFDVLTRYGRERERKHQAARKVIAPAIEAVREASTPRRREMARRLGLGQPIKQIAAEMRASRNTVADVKRRMK